MLGPATADNGPFWAGSEVESVTAQSHRPHVVKGIKQCTPEVTEHNSKRKTLVTTIVCHHQSRSFLRKDTLLLERIKSNSYKLQLLTFLTFFMLCRREASSYFSSQPRCSRMVTAVVISVKATELWSCCQGGHCLLQRARRQVIATVWGLLWKGKEVGYTSESWGQAAAAEI